MISSHLTPELRVNKNGIPVIKHVNNQKSSQVSKAIPAPAPVAPSSSPYPARNKDVASLVQGYVEHWTGLDNTGEVTSSELEEKLKTYSDHTIQILAKNVGDGAHQTYYAELGSLILNESDEKSIREYAMYSYEITDCEDLNETLNYIRGVRHYKQLQHVSDLSLANKDEEASARALIRIAFNIHSEQWMTDKESPYADIVPDFEDESKKMPVIKEPSLVSLVANNPSRAADIAEYVEEHGYTTTKVLAEMVEGTHHATREGFL